MDSNITLVGINHVTAPVEIRERLTSFFNVLNDPFELKQLYNFNELFFISTCNRFELLVISADHTHACNILSAYLCEKMNIPYMEGEKYIYSYCNEQAVGHLFKVASSLDSMIIGEPQILGQMKEAYRQITDAKLSGTIINKILHKAFFTAKRVRNETKIGNSAVSISYAAVELARKIFDSLQGKKVMLIGAGEMAELAAEHFKKHGCSQIIVVNRTLSKAIELAESFNGKTAPFDDRLKLLDEVDIVLSSTGAPDFIIKKEDAKGLMRKRRNRPLFLIDIAVPRDIDPALNDIGNVFVYDIDGLKGVIASNIKDREKEALKANHIIDEEVVKLMEWLKTLSVVPTIKAIKTKAELICRNELNKTLNNMSPLTKEDSAAIETLTHSIMNKLLNDPIIFLKRKKDRKTLNIFLDYTRQLFNLDDD